MAEAIRRQVEAAPLTGGVGSIAITVSLGILCAPAGMTVQEGIRQADMHLYAAKSSGRNRVAADTH